MSFSRIFNNFQQMPFYLKLIGVGSLILAVSTVLPWYSDVDAYRIGDMFLGVTGPASFVGIVILLLSVGSFAVFLTHLLERRQPRLPVKQPVFQLFVGLESLFLLLLVNSIYFHAKFGVNITLKESRFGMLLAILSSIVLIVGGYLQNKKEAKTEDLIGKLEPLVTLSKKPSEPASSERPHVPLEKTRKWGPVEASQEQLLKERREMQRNLGYAQRQQEAIKPEPRKEKAESVEPKDKEGGGKSGSYLLRMDL